MLVKIYRYLVDIYRRINKYGRILKSQEVYFPIDAKIKHQLYGNYEAQWCVAQDYINDKSVVYSFGVGTDVSFDISIIERNGCSVFAFDPTPRSIDWIRGQKLPGQFKFFEFGISKIDGTIKFFPPSNQEHVSFSINKKFEKSKGIDLPVYRLKSIMKMLGHRKIDILKMDIEGSEYSVIHDLIESNISVKQLMIEFHHRFDYSSVNKTKDAINSLRSIGFRIFYVSPTGEEYSFIKSANNN